MPSSHRSTVRARARSGSRAMGRQAWQDTERAIGSSPTAQHRRPAAARHALACRDSSSVLSLAFACAWLVCHHSNRQGLTAEPKGHGHHSLTDRGRLTGVRDYRMGSSRQSAASRTPRRSSRPAHQQRSTCTTDATCIRRGPASSAPRSSFAVPLGLALAGMATHRRRRAQPICAAPLAHRHSTRPSARREPAGCVVTSGGARPLVDRDGIWRDCQPWVPPVAETPDDAAGP